MKTLKLGDRIYQINEEQRITAILTITVLGQKMALCRNKERVNFWIEYKEQPKVVSRFLRGNAYMIETHELQKRFTAQNMRDEINTVNWATVDIDDIERILNIVKGIYED